MTDTSTRKCKGVSESNSRKTIISTWKRAIRDQLIQTWHLILRVIIRQYTIKNCLRSIWKTNVTVMMEDHQPETNIEDVVHIISGWNMSSRYYLPLRHDAVRKYLFRAHIKKHNPDGTIEYNREFVRIRVQSQRIWLLVEHVDKNSNKNTTQQTRCSDMEAKWI